MDFSFEDVMAEAMSYDYDWFKELVEEEQRASLDLEED